MAQPTAPDIPAIYATMAFRLATVGSVAAGVCMLPVAIGIGYDLVAAIALSAIASVLGAVLAGLCGLRIDQQLLAESHRREQSHDHDRK